MTRRERKERRLARRLEWAQSRDQKAATAFEGVRRIADNIPLGQPILVGHHSEKRARKDQARIEGGMAKGMGKTGVGAAGGAAGAAGAAAGALGGLFGKKKK